MADFTDSSDSMRHDSRFDYEADDFVRQMIRPEFLQLSLEEYAARDAHNWGCFSFHQCRFRDPVLAVWVKRFGEIFESADELERCRAEYLTANEVAEVKRQAAEGL